MSTNLQKSLQKLKSKSEYVPKFTALQTQTILNNIYVFDCSLDIDTESVISICKKHQTDQFKEKETVSVYAWRSDYLHVSDNLIPNFNNLFDVVLSKVNNIDKDTFQSRYIYEVDHFWFAIYNNGDSSLIHNHGMIDYACVYYASVPKNSAPLIIPSHDGAITIDIKPGMLVVMPGLCDHRVPKSEHEGERIIVALNLLKKHQKNKNG